MHLIYSHLAHKNIQQIYTKYMLRRWQHLHMQSLKKKKTPVKNCNHHTQKLNNNNNSQKTTYFS